MNFIQQAYKGENDFWRYIVSFLVILIGWQFIGAIPLLVVAIMHSKDMNDFMESAQNNFLNSGMNSNLFLFLMILTFAIGLVFLFIGIKYIHKRSKTSLITSRAKIDWKRFFYSFSVWFLFSVAMLVIGYFMEPEIFTWNFKPIPFLILVIISFVMLPLQTSFEELFFRGYMMQGLGILVKNRWFPLIFTSVLFGLLHGANPEVEKLGYIVMVYYIGTGFLLGIITLMDEGTELSLGFHAANNIVAAIFVTTNWTVFQTEAFFIDTSEPKMDFQVFIPVLIIYPIILFVFSRKYGWTNWKEKLFGKITKPTTAKTTPFFEEKNLLEL
jgi:membrane protease YdiL (CAAX protease family)